MESEVPKAQALSGELCPEAIPEIETLTVQSLKIYAISDVHCEQAQNMQWIKDLEAPPCPDGHVNLLLAPGDIATGMKKLKEALQLFKDKFQEVVYLPGNHELWSSEDSLAEMGKCTAVCSELGVRTEPVAVSLPDRTVFVMPLQSWYHHSWDKEPDLPHEITKDRAFLGPFHTRWGDFSFCKWPTSMTRGADWKPMGRAVPLIARKMAAMNNPWLAALSRRRGGGDVVVSLSHFLPRQELLPEKRFLLEPFLPKVSGSDFLRQQVVEAAAKVHVFGHTHIPMDVTLDGVRYVQWSLGSKHEVATCAGPRGEGPLELWDSAEGMRPSRTTHWSEYYENNPRDTTQTELAPWVVSHLAELKAKYGALAAPPSPKDRKRPPSIGQTQWRSFGGSGSLKVGAPSPAAAASRPTPSTPEGRFSGTRLAPTTPEVGGARRPARTSSVGGLLGALGFRNQSSSSTGPDPPPPVPFSATARVGMLAPPPAEVSDKA